MEPIKIKLKECCLTCEHYSPDGLAGFGIGCGTSREISCGHMPVCYKYMGHKPVNAVRCGECRHWCTDGTYGLDLDGTKQQYGTCDITQRACKENHFCSYGRKNG